MANLADLRPGVRCRLTTPTIAGWAGAGIILHADRDGVAILREDRGHVADRLAPAWAHHHEVAICHEQSSPAATRIRSVLQRAGLIAEAV